MPEVMLDYLRIALYSLLLILGFFLYQAWDKDHPKPSYTPAAIESVSDRYTPEIADTQTSTAVTPTAATAPAKTAIKGQMVHVVTDLIDVGIDTQGGDITEVKLLKYPESLGSKTPFVLLNDNPKTRYIAESGLLSKQGPDTSREKAVYSVAQTNYSLTSGSNEINVDLNWKNAEGVEVTKRFTFTRGSYEVKVNYDINNQSTTPWQGNLYAQLMRTNEPPPAQGGLVNLTTYFGAAISTPQKTFEKISFKDMQQNPITQPSTDGWAAMIQHYFISAWIPSLPTTTTYYSKALQNGLYSIGMVGQQLQVSPGAKATTGAKLYVGPAIAEDLEKAAPNLKLTIDYGWFWFISIIIFWMMQKIYDVVGNWGWSIVLVTIIIKLLFYHLSAKSYRSMSGLKKLQPRIEALKERFGDDKQKLTQATLELYKQEKVNPMSGCLPVLIQIPVFIALYWVLVESVQLRQAPWILWIHDLSQADPYYVLPGLMGLSMFLQQRLNPPPPDPMQAKLMMFMPVIFTLLFLNFPAGLMLYWFVNNTLSFLQQWYIMHRINHEAKK